MDRLFFFPDTHRPYHDKRKYGLALKACQQFLGDTPKGFKKRTIIGGDFGDCYCVSDHDKNPARSTDLEWELEDVATGIKEVRQASGEEADIDYTEGNHENRLDRFLVRKAPELFGLCRFKDLVGLDKWHVRYHAYRKHITIGKLHVTHDTGNAGAYAHYKALALAQGNIVINHTHRIGYAIAGSVFGKPHVGAMFGHLSDVEEIDYAHRMQVSRDWAHGFGVGYMDPDTGFVHLVPVPIVNNRVVIEGRVIKG